MTTDYPVEPQPAQSGMAAEVEAESSHAPSGTSPWALAWRRLRRNKVSLAFGVLFLLLLVLALAAPLYADWVGTTPSANNVSAVVTVDGEEKQVVDFEGVPIGPTWQKEFFIGADSNGRDVMVRLLYGARNSLFIGLTAALITVLLAVILGVTAGYFRGWTDWVISRGFDVMWAFPVLLLGVALGVSLALGDLEIFPFGLPVIFTIRSGSLWVPTLIIGVVGVVYLARPIRGQILALREKEFVEAARAQGSGNLRIMFGELLPNIASTLLVFVPLIVANAILLEAALSFLGAGVQPPAPSWGTMIADGLRSLISAPHQTFAPGLMLVLTVLSLNIFGEGVRDALDPRAKIKLEN